MQQISATEWTFGPYSVRSDELVLRFHGSVIALAPKVVATAVAFFDAPGRIIAKSELMERIWPDTFVDDANLTQNIYVLRKLFEEHASGVRIENVPKRGYRLVATAKASAPSVVAQLPAPVRSTHASRVWVGLAAVVVVVAGVGSFAWMERAKAGDGAERLAAAPLQQYMLGRYYLDRGTPGALTHSAALFGSVVREAPGSALGYAGLAEADTSKTFFASDGVERTRLSAQAIASAREAVRLGPSSAEAYAALGAVATSIQHDDAAGTAAFERSLQLDSRNLNALLWYGTALMNHGHAAEARALFVRALAVDPSVPGTIASLAWADFLLRDYPEAAAYSRQLIQAHHFAPMAQMTLAISDVQRRDFADALPEIRVLARQAGMETQAGALLAQTYALLGRQREGLGVLQRLDRRTNPDAIGSWDVLALAAAYARLGRPDTAFVWLQRVQSSERAQLARDPRFDVLRNDRRFDGWISG